MQKAPYDIIIFLVVVSVLIIVMVTFILILLYLYRKRQIHFQMNLEQMKLDYEKTLMRAQLEMQEETSQHISREIHDNISLSLTLAKLHLLTLDSKDLEKSFKKVEASVKLLTESIAGLSDISKGLNTDVIIQQGLLKATEDEMLRIRQAGLFNLEVAITGNPVYLDNQKELIIFRIIQEAFNNIIKHAGAANAKLALHYNNEKLEIKISDDGKGFENLPAEGYRGAGLKNMTTRIKTLNGDMHICSLPCKGTTLSFNIPFE